MLIDNTAGLRYLLNEDIYLLKQDIDNLETFIAVQATPIAGHVATAGQVVAEPVVEAEQKTAEEPVAATVQQPVVAEPAALYFSYLGANAKQFLILCSYPAAEHMDDKHQEALKSALQRKELALDDVAILNIAKYPTATVAQLTEYFKPSRLLLLGAPTLLTGWDKLTLNQLTNLGGIKALYSFSFTEMMGDRDKTKAFWEQMKVL